MNIKSIIFALSAVVLTSCVVVSPGTVGVKNKLGKLSNKVIQPGIVGVNPLITRVITVPTRTVNLEVPLYLPSKEGLNVLAEISILYHIEAIQAPNVIQTVGENYEQVMILSVFRSAAANVCSRYMAKDMHSGQRAEIEGAISNHMDSLLIDRGFVIESVLMKSIKLPPGLYDAIESKLEAEQIAQRMEFELEQERLEAKRKKIEAEGTRDAQKVLAEGLTDEIIKWRSLEVFENLSNSPNAKLIFTDGSAPMLLNEDLK
jgi:regulator of protease activity HflC (stomatin/prohibitin superfamily)